MDIDAKVTIIHISWRYNSSFIIIRINNRIDNGD